MTQGQILVTGGGRIISRLRTPRKPASATAPISAYTVDLNVDPPVVAQAKPMQMNRQFANAVVLPNGEVLIVGGNTCGLQFSDEGAIFTPEIWNPTPGAWRTSPTWQCPAPTTRWPCCCPMEPCGPAAAA